MKKTGIVLAVMFAAVTVFAHDSDTLAFYAFKERSPENQVSGTTVVNAAGDAYNGTVELGSASADTIVYKSDAPGPYVFDSSDYGADMVCTNPQSLYFAGGTSEGNQVISFADLATAISSNDDYTVEFFVKMDPADSSISSWTPVLKMECGMLYNPKPGVTAEEEVYTDTAQMTRILFVFNKALLYTYVRNATWHPILTNAEGLKGVSGSSYCDGYWHHYAMVYKSSEKKMYHYLDYGLASGSRTTTNSVVEVSKPVLLGNGGFRGKVSCLRVSKTAREKRNFLRCSTEPKLWLETVFHWRFDGENGSAISTVSNVCAKGSVFSGQYIGALESMCDGRGTAMPTNDGGVAISPLYTNEVPRSGRSVIMSGNTRVGKNNGSAHLFSKTRTTEAYAVGGAYLSLQSENHNSIDSGSFTFEAWMKFDHETWKRKIIDAEANTALWRLTLFGLPRPNYHFDWVLFLTSTPAKNPNVEGYVLNMQVYDHSPSNSNYGFLRSIAYYDYNGMLTDNKWHHYAVVYDDSSWTFKLYFDGDLKCSLHIDTPFLRHTNYGAKSRYVVGSECNNCSFEGLVDEVRLVRRALEPSEFLKPRTSIAITFK